MTLSRERETLERQLKEMEERVKAEVEEKERLLAEDPSKYVQRGKLLCDHNCLHVHSNNIIIEHLKTILLKLRSESSKNLKKKSGEKQKST